MASSRRSGFGSRLTSATLRQILGLLPGNSLPPISCLAGGLFIAQSILAAPTFFRHQHRDRRRVVRAGKSLPAFLGSRLVCRHQEVVALRRREAGSAILVGHSLVLGVQPLGQLDSARNEADPGVGERLALVEQENLDRRSRLHADDRVAFGHQFQAMPQGLHERGIVLRRLL